jgi:hypothetical protein
VYVRQAVERGDRGPNSPGLAVGGARRREPSGGVGTNPGSARECGQNLVHSGRDDNLRCQVAHEDTGGRDSGIDGGGGGGAAAGSRRRERRDGLEVTVRHPGRTGMGSSDVCCGSMPTGASVGAPGIGGHAGFSGRLPQCQDADDEDVEGQNSPIRVELSAWTILALHREQTSDLAGRMLVCVCMLSRSTLTIVGHASPHGVCRLRRGAYALPMLGPC